MIRDKKILIVGAGISGVGAAKLLLDAGSRPVLYDGNSGLPKETVRSGFGDSNGLRIVFGELPDEVKSRRKW